MWLTSVVRDKVGERLKTKGQILTLYEPHNFRRGRFTADRYCLSAYTGSRGSASTCVLIFCVCTLNNTEISPLYKLPAKLGITR
jgi:hypothetical protein